MSKLSKPNVGLEEARPFAGMSQVHAHAAGMDIEPTRSWSVSREGIRPSWCVRLGATPLTCKPLGCGLQNMASRLWRWKVPECTGSRCSRNWREEAFTAT